MATEMKERLTRVEIALEEFIRQSNIEFHRSRQEMREFKEEMKDFKDEMKDFKDEVKDFKDEMKDFKDEMKDFKDEMKDFKDEMKDFKDEMKDFKDEMKDFKEEMKDFKEEMREYKEESRQTIKDMKKAWGELANKLGTLVEDIIIPGVNPVIKKYFNDEPYMIAPHLKKFIKAQGLRGEFDLVLLSETTIYLVEAKATPNKEKILALKEETTQRFRQLFPEYDSLKLVPILAALRFEEDLIEFASKENIYLLAYREWNYLDILNFDNVKI